MSDPYPDFAARFYDTVYAQVRDGTDNAFSLDRMAAAAGVSRSPTPRACGPIAASPVVACRRPPD